MSGRICQNVGLQLKENTDRTVGVIDGEGVVIACSELSMIGQRWSEYVAAVNGAAGSMVCFDGKTFKALSGWGNQFDYAVFAFGDNEISKTIFSMATVALNAAKSYYEENKATYDSVDYRLTTSEADLPTEPTELADPVEETAADTTGTTDGTAATDSTQDTAYQPSDAEIAKAMEDAKVLADDAEQTVPKDGEAHENEKKSSVNYLISDWLFDDARKAGDTTVITNDNSHCYYAVAFEKRYLDETPSADVRVIIPTEDKTGEEILEEWKNGAATEDSFAELCKKYTQDTSAVENGGLFEQVTKTGMTEELSNWIFDSSRQAGDTVAITVSDSTYVLYYIGQDQPEWKINIKNTLVSDTMSQHMQDITADVTVEDPKGKLNYLKVQAEESAADETAAAETQEITEEQTAATEETTTQAQ